MDLSIQKLTKAFNHKTIFKDLSFEIRTGSRFAIAGANGSGKSTLIKILSGGTLASSGKINYTLSGKKIDDAKLYRLVHFVAPYNTVIEELSLVELFDLHQRLGLLKNHKDFKSWKALLQYPFVSDQQIKMYSSGMKQRVRLALALLDDRPLILLDEPGSNLDLQGKAWFQSMLGQLSNSQTVIIATNDPVELGYCSERLDLE